MIDGLIPPGPQLPDTTIEDARKAGLNVETNDSGELVDELSILAPGLNRMPKEQPLSLLGNASGSGSGRGGGQLGGAPYKGQRVGAAASTREVRERQERLIRDQLADEQLRLVKEQEERERAREVRECWLLPLDDRLLMPYFSPSHRLESRRSGTTIRPSTMPKRGMRNGSGGSWKRLRQRRSGRKRRRLLLAGNDFETYS